MMEVGICAQSQALAKTKIGRWSIFFIPCLACLAIGGMLAGMFELTRREQWLVAGFVFILVLGLGVQHWRQTHPLQSAPPNVQQPI